MRDPGNSDLFPPCEDTARKSVPTKHHICLHLGLLASITMRDIYCSSIQYVVLPSQKLEITKARCPEYSKPEIEAELCCQGLKRGQGKVYHLMETASFFCKMKVTEISHTT